MSKRARGIAAFVAGFGTGYMNAEAQKREDERQAKRDEMERKRFELEQKRAEREDRRAEQSDAVDAQVAAIPKETYGTKREMGAEDVRGMMGGSADPNAENYVSDEAATHYLNNNTGVGQVSANAADFARRGVGNNLGGMKAIQGEEGVRLADPNSAKARPAWKILEQAAKVRIGSGVPQQEQVGYQALAYAQTIKSQEAREGALKAYQTEGLDGVMKFMSNWDNDDYPITNIRMDAGPGGYDPSGKQGTIKFLGDMGGKTVTLKSYDMSKLPEGMTLEDAVMQDVQALTDPKAMFDIRREQLKMLREDKGNQRQQANIDRQHNYNVDRDQVKDEQWKMSHDADQAQRRFDNYMKSENFKADEKHRSATLGLERDKLAAEGGKVRDTYRQDFNAAIAAFDKSFKRDALGNVIGNDLDSKLYSEAADVIGQEILNGVPIAQAQAIGRQVYDEARKGKVSASAAYAAVKKRQTQASAQQTPAAAGGTASGASAVDGFFGQ